MVSDDILSATVKIGTIFLEDCLYQNFWSFGASVCGTSAMGNLPTWPEYCWFFCNSSGLVWSHLVLSTWCFIFFGWHWMFFCCVSWIYIRSFLLVHRTLWWSAFSIQSFGKPNKSSLRGRVQPGRTCCINGSFGSPTSHRRARSGGFTCQVLQGAFFVGSCYSLFTFISSPCLNVVWFEGPPVIWNSCVDLGTMLSWHLGCFFLLLRLGVKKDWLNVIRVLFSERNCFLEAMGWYDMMWTHIMWVAMYFVHDNFHIHNDFTQELEHDSWRCGVSHTDPLAVG